jgi:outer membrane protein assembly factor BamB
MTIVMLSGCGGAGAPSLPSSSPGSGTRSAAHEGVRKRSYPTTDWDSFGFDLERTGYNPDESVVGPGNIGTLQQLWHVNVGYGMVHEPVFAYHVTLSGQATNVLYAGSSNGSAMYAINASNGAILWKDPVPSTPYRCYQQNLTFSIGETPAIDRGKNLLYFSDGQNQVHAVDLASGKEASGWPISIAQYGSDHNFMHGGLTYNAANGMLYGVTGSQVCDISPWHGRVVAIDTNGPSIAGSFFPMSGNSTQGASGGGIWGPGGASIDPTTNNVFIATGNADTHKGAKQNADYSEQIVELSANLGTILANSYPTNIPIINGDNDFDFGATPMLFQPYGCPLLLAALNKSGMFELYDVGTMEYGPIQYIAMSIPTDKGAFVGVPAFDPVTGYVYVGMPATEGLYKPGMAAFSMASNCTLNATPVWNAKFGPDATKLTYLQTPRSPISIANGVVYIANHNRKRELAFDASSGAELWNIGLSNNGDIGTVIADGVVYVSSFDGTITAWAPPASLKKRKNADNSPPVKSATPLAALGALDRDLDLR